MMIENAPDHLYDFKVDLKNGKFLLGLEIVPFTEERRHESNALQAWDGVQATVVGRPSWPGAEGPRGHHGLSSDVATG